MFVVLYFEFVQVFSDGQEEVEVGGSDPDQMKYCVINTHVCSIVRAEWNSSIVVACKCAFQTSSPRIAYLDIQWGRGVLTSSTACTEVSKLFIPSTNFNLLSLLLVLNRTHFKNIKKTTWTKYICILFPSFNNTGFLGVCFCLYDVAIDFTYNLTLSWWPGLILWHIVHDFRHYSQPLILHIR